MRFGIVFAVASFTSLTVSVMCSPTPGPHEGHHGWHEPGSELAATAVVASNSSHHAHSPPPSSHSHSHGGTPLSVLNETQVLEGHAPDPLSYLAFDLYGIRQGYKSGWGDDAFDTVVYSDTLKSHGWWMVWHVVLMMTAFFGALPIAIVLRSSNHPLQPIAHIAFVVLSTLGWIAGSAYKKHTPDLYTRSSHSPWGIILVLVAFAFFLVERIGSVRRFLSHVQNMSERRGGKLKWSEVWRSVKGRREAAEEDVLLMDERGIDVGAIVFDAEQVQESHWANEDTSPSSSSRVPGQSERPNKHSRQFSIDSATSTLHNSPTEIGSFDFAHRPHSSYRPLPANHLSADVDSLPQHVTPRPWSQRIIFVVERLIVVTAYVTTVSGTTIYMGGCRDNYLNGCMAHLIKGSIFFLYGLGTFARYLGAWSDLGWAWNAWVPPVSQSYSASVCPRSIFISKKRSRSAPGEASPIDFSRDISPSGHLDSYRRPHQTTARRPPSAELVESSVILFYGATNTFMERFGAAPGSPYTAKQIQHISIAVMYFFAGCLGVALELGWLSRRRAKKRSHVYKPSYNPFAALCIGITGIAMAAHHQTYVFQVQIHVLWGALLALYAPARIFTYVLMWARSSASSEEVQHEGERSTLPSPPPTEAIAAFFLTSGGVAFISSTEQIGFWAMRSGRDDVMMFANAIVALVFLCFTWVFALMAVKTWADSGRNDAAAVIRARVRERLSFDEAEEVETQYQPRAQVSARGSP
ncbi:hypothetical protein FRB94_001091 [Tulasnella sp. JGI-2019a]|nr:hypothetical protein FRB94_001091 [Tulasnella sp. JGI-2019a]